MSVRTDPATSSRTEVERRKWQVVGIGMCRMRSAMKTRQLFMIPTTHTSLPS